MSDREMRVSAIDLAIERGGGILAFAKALGVSHQAIYNWRVRGWAPPTRALAIERLYGVNRQSMMNPDLVRVLSAPVSDIQ